MEFRPERSSRLLLLHHDLCVRPRALGGQMGEFGSSNLLPSLQICLRSGKRVRRAKKPVGFCRDPGADVRCMGEESGPRTPMRQPRVSWLAGGNETWAAGRNTGLAQAQPQRGHIEEPVLGSRGLSASIPPVDLTSLSPSSTSWAFFCVPSASLVHRMRCYPVSRS